MQIKQTLVRLVGASLIAVGVVPLIGGASSANTTGTATTTENTDTSAAQCVDPALSVFSVDRLDATTYRVSLKDPATITCTPVTFNVGSWTIPETWDRKGFNQTALPQVEFDYAALTFPAGGKEPVTATVKVPSCGPFQTDIYAGVRRPSRLLWPNPLGADRIKGTMRDQAPCVTPTPTVTTPTVTTPSVTTPTPTVTEAPNTVTTSPAVAPVTSATSTPTDTPSVLGIKVSKTVTPVQVSRVPSGGVQAGGGSTAGLQHVQLLALGGSLLLAGAIGLLFRRRLAQGAARSPR